MISETEQELRESILRGLKDIAEGNIVEVDWRGEESLIEDLQAFEANRWHPMDDNYAAALNDLRALMIKHGIEVSPEVRADGPHPHDHSVSRDRVDSAGAFWVLSRNGMWKHYTSSLRYESFTDETPGRGLEFHQLVERFGPLQFREDW